MLCQCHIFLVIKTIDQSGKEMINMYICFPLWVYVFNKKNKANNNI